MDSPKSAMPGWSLSARFTVFILSATSIWCLLAEFYGLCSMRAFTFAISIPATIALAAIAIYDRWQGNKSLWRGILVGALSGFLAACVYDLFRIPFVLAAADKLGPAWLRLPLFRVFPRFGALILNQPFDATTADSEFTLSAHLVGWLYHFSNGITFGIMYVALVGDLSRRSWLWAVLFATSLEFAMLLTPYTSFFGIPMTARFIVATFAAHAIFGLALGIAAQWLNDFALRKPAAA